MEASRATPAARSGQPARDARAASFAAAAVLVLEVLGSAAMWLPIPLAWMWIGGRVFALTGSLAADGAVTFLGFVGSIYLAVQMLLRVDGVWVGLRRRAGHDQEGGALSEVVAISATLGLLMFALWYYVLSDAYVLPFMGNGQ
jgi:hypothetical protein